MVQKNTLILLIYASFSLLTFSAIADANKIVKWVGSDGVTHYGDKLPSQEAGRNNIEMRNNGVVIKQNIRADKKTEILDQQKEQERLAQERANKVLLASYTKPEEIDLACERNLETDQAALESLTQQQKNILSKTVRNKKLEQGFKDKKKPIPNYLADELKQAQLEIVSTNKNIAQRKQNMQTTRKHYASEKSRFVSLKQSQLKSIEPALLTNSDL